MIEIRTITDLKTAEDLWRKLSPQRSIFDDWGFRFCFYKHDPFDLCFLAAFEAGELVGLLPLQANNDWGGFEFFAEDPCEENRVFIKAGREDIIPRLYESISGRAKLYDISGEDDYTKKLEIEDFKYVLPLAGLKDFAGYMGNRLSAKKQRNFRAEFRKVEDLRPEIVYNDRSAIEDLFAINSREFPDSYLQSEKERAGWRDLLSLPYDWQVVSIKIGGRVAAASLSVLFNGTYYYLINGADSAISHLGKYLNKANLERAISLGAGYWDAGLGDCNWKEAWHLDKVPQYQFENEKK